MIRSCQRLRWLLKENKHRQSDKIGVLLEDMSDEPKLSMNEHDEPVSGNAQMPVGVAVVLTLLGYIGCTKVDELNANFAGNVHAPFGSPVEVASLAPSEEQLIIMRGKALYAKNCMACHQSDGGGSGNVNPPLANSPYVLENPERLSAILIKGLGGPIEVLGTTYNGAMPAWENTLSEVQIAEVLTFIRQEWGNSAGRITAEEVSKVSAKIQEQGQSQPWTEPELSEAFSAE